MPRAEQMQQSPLPQHFLTLPKVILPAQNPLLSHHSNPSLKDPDQSHYGLIAVTPKSHLYAGVESKGKGSFEQNYLASPQMGLPSLHPKAPHGFQSPTLEHLPIDIRRSPDGCSSPVCRHPGESSSRHSAVPLRSAYAATLREWPWSGSTAAPRA